MYDVMLSPCSTEIDEKFKTNKKQANSKKELVYNNEEELIKLLKIIHSNNSNSKKNNDTEPKKGYKKIKVFNHYYEIKATTLAICTILGYMIGGLTVTGLFYIMYCIMWSLM